MLGWLRNLLQRKLIGEKLGVIGYVEIDVKRNGKVIKTIRGFNRVVLQGREYMLKNIMKYSTTYDGSYLALSTSSSTPSDNETSVPNPISPIKLATKSYDPDSSEPRIKWEATWSENEGNGNTINSVAICESSTGSGEWARYVLTSGINKTSDIAVTVRYYIKLANP